MSHPPSPSHRCRCLACVGEAAQDPVVLPCERFYFCSGGQYGRRAKYGGAGLRHEQADRVLSKLGNVMLVEFPCRHNILVYRGSGISFAIQMGQFTILASVCLSPSLSLSIHLRLCLSISVYPPVCLFTVFCLYRSRYLSVYCLYVHLSSSPSLLSNVSYDRQNVHLSPVNMFSRKLSTVGWQGMPGGLLTSIKSSVSYTICVINTDSV